MPTTSPQKALELTPATWTLLANYASGGDQALRQKPISYLVAHSDNVSDLVEVIVDPLHGDFSTAPGVGVEGVPVYAGTSREFIDRSGDGDGVINRVWVKSAGAAIIGHGATAA